MVARPAINAAPTEAPPAAGRSDDDETVRRYLRAVLGAPVTPRDSADTAEAAFVEVAARWCGLRGVDRRTLLRLGVSTRVLEAAGVQQPAAIEVLRRFLPAGPFSAADLSRRSGLSKATVRTLLADEEAEGRVRRAAVIGRAVRWERSS